MRGLHGACERGADQFLPFARGDERREKDHYYRGAGERGSAAPDAGGFYQTRRISVWVLHLRADHVGRGAGKGRAHAVQGTDQRVHEREYLPLRCLFQYCQSDPGSQKQSDMNPFQYTRSSVAASAIQSLVKEPQAHLLAGGTNLIDLMKMGVVVPERLVDINPLPLRSVEKTAAGLRI